MDTPIKIIAEKDQDVSCIPTTELEDIAAVSDIVRGEGEHDGIGIRENGHGFLYQLKLCMLCLLRALKIQDLSISVNMTAEHKRLHPFDDIVLMFNIGGDREYHLVQVKHGKQLLEDKKIKAKDFLKEKYNNWGNEFTLLKYFNGYCKLKELAEFSSVSTNFIICTNIDLDFGDLQKHRFFIESYENPLFNHIIKESNGNLYKLVSKEKSVIFDALAGKELSDDKRKMINSFIKDFILAINLPNEQMLGKIIIKEMGAMFESIDPKLIAPQFQDRLLDWLTQWKGKWLSTREVCTFTEQMVDDINSLPSKGLDISYKLKKINTLISDEHLINFRETIECFLSGEEHLLQIINQNSSYLSLLKVYQTLKWSEKINFWEKQSKNVLLYIQSKSFSTTESRSHLKSAMKNENNYKLMVIYCKKKSELPRIFLYKLVEVCSEIKKKIILISDEDIELKDLEEEIPTLKIRREEDVGFTFLQLTSESKESLLCKKIVSFQGNFEKTSLSLLVMAEDTISRTESLNKLNEIIDSNVLVQLIKGKELKVGKIVDETKVLSDIYLDRQLKNGETSKIILEKDLLSVSNRVVIIIDEAGSGKSTLLNSIIRNLKETKPYQWICRINFINYTDVFNREVVKRREGENSYSSTEPENTLIFFINTLLDSQANTKLETVFEKNLLRLALQGYVKVFLIFDGFDEICPNYKDVVLDLLVSLHQLKFEKLFVTSRKNDNTCPIEISEGVYLKTVRLTEEEQIKFLVEYWAKEADVEDEQSLTMLRNIAKETRYKAGIYILGNPLVLFWTSEYMRDTIISLCNESHQGPNNVQYPDVLSHRNRKVNFLELCRCFIDKQILIYQIDKSKHAIGNISSDNKHTFFINAVQSVHTYLALTALFGELKATELSRKKPLIDDYIRIELPKIGLVYEQGNNFIFVHRTFAGFFVTEFIRSHPQSCGTVIETLIKDLPWWDVVFEYITDSWFESSEMNKDSIDRIKQILFYIALMRRFRRKTTVELTGDEGPNIDEELKEKLLSSGFIKEGRPKSRNWAGLSFVYWRIADYFVKKYLKDHPGIITRVSNHHHADVAYRFFWYDSHDYT